MDENKEMIREIAELLKTAKDRELGISLESIRSLIRK